MVFSVHRANFVEKWAKAINLLTRVLVVRFLDVGDQVSQCRRCHLVLLVVACGILRHFEGVQHLVDRHIRCTTSLFEGLLPPQQ